MGSKKGLQRLFRWPRLRPEPGAVDPADMGTAYGMELSIEETAGNDATAFKPASALGRPGPQQSDPTKQR